MLLTQDFSSNVDELRCSAVCSGSSWLLLGPSLCAQAVGTELDRSWVLSEQQSASPCLPPSLPPSLPAFLPLCSKLSCLQVLQLTQGCLLPWFPAELPGAHTVLCWMEL